MDRYEAADWLFEIIIKRKFLSTGVSEFLKQEQGITDKDFHVEVSDVLKRSGLVKEWGKYPNWNKLCATTAGIEAIEKYGSLSKYLAANKADEISESEKENFIVIANNSSTVNFASNVQSSSDFQQSRDTIIPENTDTKIKKKSLISELFSIKSIADIIKGVFIGLVIAIIIYIIFRQTGIRL